MLVVGLGLIGGSVALRLRERGVRVRGVTRSADTLRRAIELGAIEGGALALADEAPRAGLVLLAAPTRTALRLLPEIGALVRPGALVTDACSTKREVGRALDALPRGVRAVGGHPMAGKERAGIGAADPRLFEGATWALTRTAHTDAEAWALAERLARLCGADPLQVDPVEHDRAVALVSHLPMLAAAALVLGAEAAGSELAWRLAASGFRDATRLAAGEPEMGADLALTNPDAIQYAERLFRRSLDAMLVAAREGDAARLRDLLESAARLRRGMYGGTG